MSNISYILITLGIIIPIILGQDATGGMGMDKPAIGYKEGKNGSIEFLGQKASVGYDINAGVGGRKRRDLNKFFTKINDQQRRTKRETDAEILEEKKNSIIQRATEIINNVFERIGQELKQIREYFHEKQQNILNTNEQ